MALHLLRKNIELYYLTGEHSFLKRNLHLISLSSLLLLFLSYYLFSLSTTRVCQEVLYPSEGAAAVAAAVLLGNTKRLHSLFFAPPVSPFLPPSLDRAFLLDPFRFRK